MYDNSTNWGIATLKYGFPQIRLQKMGLPRAKRVKNHSQGGPAMGLGEELVNLAVSR